MTRRKRDDSKHAVLVWVNEDLFRRLAYSAISNGLAIAPEAARILAETLDRVEETDVDRKWGEKAARALSRKSSR